MAASPDGAGRSLRPLAAGVIACLVLCGARGHATGNAPGIVHVQTVWMASGYPNPTLGATAEAWLDEFFERDFGLGPESDDTACCFALRFQFVQIDFPAYCRNIAFENAIQCADIAQLRLGTSPIVTVESIEGNSAAFFVETTRGLAFFVARNNGHYAGSSARGLASSLVKTVYFIRSGTLPVASFDSGDLRDAWTQWDGSLKADECSTIRSLRADGHYGCPCHDACIEEDSANLPDGRCNLLTGATCIQGRCDGAGGDDCDRRPQAFFCVTAGPAIGICVDLPGEDRQCLPVASACGWLPNGTACDPGVASSVCNFGNCIDPIHYVALGDSFSSGDGVRPYEPGTNRILLDQPEETWNLCRRSRYSYARLVRVPGGSLPIAEQGDAGSRFDFIACSGAETRDVLGTFDRQPGLWGEPHQLDRYLLTPETDLVTITIGGNDAHFGELVRTCTLDPFNCRNGLSPFSRNWEEYLPRHIETTVRSRVRRVLEQILSETGPGTTIVLLGYPPLVSGTECADLELNPPGLVPTLRIDEDEQQFALEIGAMLNRVLGEVADEVGVHFLAVDEYFRGHEVCGPEQDYLLGLVSAKSPDEALRDGDAMDRKNSLHPNRLGHAAYAAALNELLSRPGLLQ